MTEASVEHLIAFQGCTGANSDMAARQAHPDMTPFACRTFEDAFEAVREDRAALAMIPIDNTVAGRVADVHNLLPESGLHITGEHYMRIDHHLMTLPGAKESELTHVHSHMHALQQCRNVIRRMGLEPVIHADTAGAAMDVAKAGDPTQASISPVLAAELYGLEILRSNIEDGKHNITRFVILAHKPVMPPPDVPCVTSFAFWVRHVPAALYKALGGFATNGVNMTKLESGVGGGSFIAAHFYAEIEGHPENRAVALAMDDLRYFSKKVRVLGVYPQHAFRTNGGRFDGD